MGRLGHVAGDARLAGSELVTAPDGSRYLRHQLEQPPGAIGIGAEALRTLDRLGDVGDEAVMPASDLVAEEPEAACRARSYGTGADDTSRGTIVFAMYLPMFELLTLIE